MLRSILIEFRRRAGSYISPSVIIVLSLLVCFVLFNLTRPFIIQYTKPKFELNRERLIMSKIESLPLFNELKESNILLEELFNEIEELDGVESITYTLNDLINANSHLRVDRIYSDGYTLKVANNFLNFFDIELLEGSGFIENNINQEVIISEIYAAKRGLKGLSSSRKIELKQEKKSVQVDIAAIYKGELNTYDYFFGAESLSRDVPILFIPMNLKDDKISAIGLSLLFKTKASSDPLLVSNQIDDIIEGSRYRDMLYSSATLPFAKHEEVYKDNLLNDFRIILIPFSIFIIYISISLLGSMTNIMEARTHEIGVRRALGHTKLQVLLFIIAEPLILFTYNAIIAIAIILSLKDMMGIIKPEEIIITGVVLIFTVVLLSLLHPLIKLLNTNHIDIIQSE